MQGFVELTKRTIREWQDDDASQLAAALAYYTTFSLAPLLVVVISLAGLVWDPSDVEGRVYRQMQALIGPDGAEFIQLLLEGAQNPADGILGTILGVGGLLIGSIGAFNQLQQALNHIWGAPEPDKRTFLESLRTLFLDRLASLGLVVGIGFLLLVSLLLTAALSALGDFFGSRIATTETLLQAGSTAVSIGVITVLFAMIFKILPDVLIAWRDVWLGALVTSILFTIGKHLLGLYLGNSAFGSSFGAAGSLALLLVWVYYSAQILFLGAEFTQVYANMYGSRLLPDTGTGGDQSGQPADPGSE